VDCAQRSKYLPDGGWLLEVDFTDVHRQLGDAVANGRESRPSPIVVPGLLPALFFSAASVHSHTSDVGLAVDGTRGKIVS
jgi:hypothetical protein